MKDRIRRDNSVTTDQYDIVGIFNDYFLNIGKNLAEIEQPVDCEVNQQHLPRSMFLSPTGVDDVLNIIIILKNNKSPGYKLITDESNNIPNESNYYLDGFNWHYKADL